MEALGTKGEASSRLVGNHLPVVPGNLMCPNQPACKLNINIWSSINFGKTSGGKEYKHVPMLLKFDSVGRGV